MVPFSSGSHSLALKSSLKTKESSNDFVQNDKFFTKTTSFCSQLSPWTKKDVIWWLFNDNLRAREREPEKKEPQIPRLSCQATFTTNEELLIHSCANIKDDKNELEDKNMLNFSDKEHQKNFEYEISLLDFSDNDGSAWQFYGAKYLFSLVPSKWEKNILVLFNYFCSVCIFLEGSVCLLSNFLVIKFTDMSKKPIILNFIIQKSKK